MRWRWLPSLCDVHRHHIRRREKKANVLSLPWLDGTTPKDLAPKIFQISRRKNRTVSAAFQDSRWVQDLIIHGGITAQHVQQFLDLWGRINNQFPNASDEITRKLTLVGNYTAKSAYTLQFLGSTIEYKKIIWKTLHPQNACSSPGYPKLSLNLWYTASERLAKPGNMRPLQTITESILAPLFSVQIY